MENELTHWGIKGMKWGIRRFQNKDGSLTPAGRKRYGEEEEETPEAREARRARTLKSTNASEIYKNRELLSTEEIRERMNRINTEQSLAEMAANLEPKKKTIMDRVGKLVETANKINEYYNSPAVKAIRKALGDGDDEKSPKSLSDIYKNRDKMSTKDLEDAKKRAEAIEKITSAMGKERNEAAKKAQDKVAEADKKAKEKADKAAEAEKKAQEKAKKNAKTINYPDAEDIVERVKAEIVDEPKPKPNKNKSPDIIVTDPSVVIRPMYDRPLSQLLEMRVDKGEEFVNDHYQP